MADSIFQGKREEDEEEEGEEKEEGEEEEEESYFLFFWLVKMSSCISLFGYWHKIQPHAHAGR